MDDFKRDEITSENLKLLTKCPVDKLTKLIHSVCDRLCDQSPPSYADYESIYCLSEWFEVQESAEKVIKRLVSDADFIKKLSEMLSPDFHKVFHDAFRARHSHLRQLMTSRNAQDGSRTYLKDFDWKLNVCLGSDKISEMRETLATIQLQMTDQDLTLELDRKELEQLIQALESANKAVNQLQT